jgi:hypothetical protein
MKSSLKEPPNPEVSPQKNADSYTGIQRDKIAQFLYNAKPMMTKLEIQSKAKTLIPQATCQLSRTSQALNVTLPLKTMVALQKRYHLPSSAIKSLTPMTLINIARLLRMKCNKNLTVSLSAAMSLDAHQVSSVDEMAPLQNNESDIAPKEIATKAAAIDLTVEEESSKETATCSVSKETTTTNTDIAIAKAGKKKRKGKKGKNSGTAAAASAPVTKPVPENYTLEYNPQAQPIFVVDAAPQTIMTPDSVKIFEDVEYYRCVVRRNVQGQYGLILDLFANELKYKVTSCETITY